MRNKTTWHYRDRWCEAYNELAEEYKELYSNLSEKELHYKIMEEVEYFHDDDDDEYYGNLDC